MGGVYMNTEDLKNIGARIVERRKELKFTQEQVAERMNVSVQMISNIERGNKATTSSSCVLYSKSAPTTSSPANTPTTIWIAWQARLRN